MNNKLLILNLGVDSENTSLAFTQKWINEISLNFDSVDVLTCLLYTSTLPTIPGV